MLAEGLLLAEVRREKRLAKLVEDYTKAQDKAKAARVRNTKIVIHKQLIVKPMHKTQDTTCDP